jgi:hypothetical protein
VCFSAIYLWKLEARYRDTESSSPATTLRSTITWSPRFKPFSLQRIRRLRFRSQLCGIQLWAVPKMKPHRCRTPIPSGIPRQRYIGHGAVRFGHAIGISTVRICSLPKSPAYSSGMRKRIVWSDPSVGSPKYMRIHGYAFPVYPQRTRFEV